MNKRRQNVNTGPANEASRRTFARRRHARYIQELEAAGVIVTVPDEYTGLPINKEDKNDA